MKCREVFLYKFTPGRYNLQQLRERMVVNRMLFEELRPGINLETTDVEFKGLIEEGKAETGKNKEIS